MHTAALAPPAGHDNIRILQNEDDAEHKGHAEVKGFWEHHPRACGAGEEPVF
jgi:hypothetical protein